MTADAYVSSPPVQALAGDSLNITEIERHCRLYSGAVAWRSVAQLAITLALFLFTFGLVLYTLPYSSLGACILMVVAAGLLTKLFIIQHDCGHGSFFKSKRTNTWVGRGLSLLTVTPYDFWRRAHNIHHATSGDLDRRSIGAIDTITVREYLALSKAKQRAYRLYRNPILLIFVGTPFYIMLVQRVPFNIPTHFYSDYKTLPSLSIYTSIMTTNACLIAFYWALGAVLGFWVLWVVCVPILILTSCIGGWLFYVQHQFEDTYWQRNEDWVAKDSALMGSSYYKLPKVMQWFTGSIGLHHIHHLCSGIPNYKLQECMEARPELETINVLTLKDSLKCLHLKLWDEDAQKLVTFKDL